MSKGTSIKEALRRWEELHKADPKEAEIIELQFQFPPIDRMDATLGILTQCTKLSLSTNAIEKIAGISQLKNLRILSLARNNIKNLNGIEALGEHLEELWMSYNVVEKLGILDQMKALKVLYLSNNNVKEWNEVSKVSGASKLEDFVFVGNPVAEAMKEPDYRAEILKRLTQIKKLDGIPCIR